MMMPLKKLFPIPIPKDSFKGFTLMEIIIVVITLGVITSLAFSNYRTIMEREYCRNAQMNLLAIDSAAKIYKIKNNTYGPFLNNLTAINTTLNLSISDDKFTYQFSGGAVNYTSWARRIPGPAAYTCSLDSSLPFSSVNPTIAPAFCTNVISPPP